jgi:hypothetical protein
VPSCGRRLLLLVVVLGGGGVGGLCVIGSKHQPGQALALRKTAAESANWWACRGQEAAKG